MEHTLQNFTVEYLNKVLKERGLSQKDISAQIDKSEQTISNYLRGVSLFSLDMFERFLESLDIEIIEVVSEYHKTVIQRRKTPAWVKSNAAAEPDESSNYGKPKKAGGGEIYLQKLIAIQEKHIKHLEDDLWMLKLDIQKIAKVHPDILKSDFGLSDLSKVG